MQCLHYAADNDAFYQVVASAVLTISAEIESSRARLEDVLTRLDKAEKEAQKRENYIRNKQADNCQERNIHFEDLQNAYDSHHLQQGGICLDCYWLEDFSYTRIFQYVSNFY